MSDTQPKRKIIKCPECAGTGEDLEDSSKECFECLGSGVVAIDVIIEDSAEAATDRAKEATGQ